MGKPSGRPPRKVKRTNAERCKTYREKNKENYNANEALQKRIYRKQLKLKSAENQLRLQRQAATKRAQRQRKKLLSELRFQF